MIRRLLTLSLLLLPLPCSAAETLAAVATNFAEVMTQLKAEFESETPHTLRVATGSTGKLYAQIVAGAPFDVFLAADRERPARLESEGLAVAGSRFTYATGTLMLWSGDAGRIGDDGAAILRAGTFRRLAIANPELAPYGAAARQTLEALGVWDRLADRIVMGENIGQAYAMVATGNAELGLVATSQLRDPKRSSMGSSWQVPVDLYEPIRQDAVLLVRAAHNEAALALVRFLKQEKAREVIREFGYGPDPDSLAFPPPG